MSLRLDRNSCWMFGLLLLGLLAYGYFVLLPQHRQLQRLHTELQNLHQMVDQDGDVLSAIQNAQKELEKVNRYIQTWQENAPNPRELAPLFGRIAELAKQAGTTTTRFSPGARVSYDRVSKIPLSIGCQGSFAQIADFLHRLESLPQILWIEHFTIEKNNQEAHLLQCEINLVIFADNPEISDQIKVSKKPI